VLGQIRSVPHLFSKVMVVVCVAGGAGCCLWAFRILSRTGHDPAALLGVTLAFFGGELVIMFAKTALCDKKHTNKEVSYD